MSMSSPKATLYRPKRALAAAGPAMLVACWLMMQLLPGQRSSRRWRCTPPDGSVGQDDAGRQHQLRLHVVGTAVVGAERAIQPLRAPAQGEAVVAAVLLGLDVLAAPGAQVGRGTGHRGRERVAGDDERVARPTARVADAQVGARLRVAVGLVVEALPVEEVLRRDRQRVGHLRLDVEADARPEQFLRLGARGRQPLPDVDRVLRVRHAVDGAAEQQALAPEHGGLAELDVDRRIADVELREREDVEELADGPSA